MLLKEKKPNQVFYIALITSEEILGKNGLNSVLNYSGLKKFIGNYPPPNLDREHSSEEFANLMKGVIDVLGERGARPILFRGGMRSFEIMHEKFPGLININGIEPREKVPERLFDEFKRIYGIIVDGATNLHGDIYKYYECDEGVALEMSPCFWCHGLKTKSPICFQSVGFEFAAARWILGQDIKVEETHCIATGDEMCRFVMHRPKI
jgi:predicted hydrocarbon binding protein